MQIFEHDTGFFDISLVDSANYTGGEGFKHTVEVILSNGNAFHTTEIELISEDEALAYVSELLSAVRKYHQDAK